MLPPHSSTHRAEDANVIHTDPAELSWVDRIMLGDRRQMSTTADERPTYEKMWPSVLTLPLAASQFDRTIVVTGCATLVVTGALAIHNDCSFGKRCDFGEEPISITPGDCLQVLSELVDNVTELAHIQMRPVADVAASCSRCTRHQVTAAAHRVAKSEMSLAGLRRASMTSLTLATCISDGEKQSLCTKLM